MDELKALRSLARAMGVHIRYTDGLGRRVVVAPETLVRVCATLGAPVERPGDDASHLLGQLYDETLLVQDITNYALGPHSDSPRKVITLLGGAAS